MPCLESVIYSRGELKVLDQLRLPHEIHHDSVSTCEEAYDSIKTMRVRGAPAIAIVASLALAVELHNQAFVSSSDDIVAYIESRLDYLKGSRPTAVDLSNAINHLKATVHTAAAESAAASESSTPNRDAVIVSYIDAAEAIYTKDAETNCAIGQHGTDWLVKMTRASTTNPISVLTHCNTGSLATAGYGTALGIIRSLHERDFLHHAFCTETRPYNQGSRLTAFELAYERIPSTLVTDSMVGALFSTRKTAMNISAIIVGADRVVRNGDTANKIGTYSLAVLARHHGIRFIVAAPTTSIDLVTETGASIKIEERPKEEMTQVSGAVVQSDGTIDPSKMARVTIADQRIRVWNPAFDVTPHELIDVIVTERGVVNKDISGKFDFQHILPERWDESSGDPF